MAMFRLSYQVAGDDGRVGCFIGNDADLGGARKNVDAHFAKQGSFGFCDKLVAWAHDHIGGFAGEQTIGHRCNRLYATQSHDDVSACLVEGIEQVGVHRATPEGA